MAGFVARMKRRNIALALGAVALVLAALVARESIMDRESPLAAFARDFSGNDPAIVGAARAFADNPPSDPETVGFYGSEDYPADMRAFLATVSLLDDAEKLYAIEDKYSQEIFQLWAEDGTIDPAQLPPAAKAVFGPLMSGGIDPDDPAVAAYRQTVWNSYARAAVELEQHILERGKALLSVDATEGDTMFFALVPPEIAERWRDTALAEVGGYRSGVRAPMGDRFWDHLSYAVGDALASGDVEGYPPGTRLRRDSIPFAER